MNKLILLVLSLTSLVPAQEQPQHLQFRDLITPIAALKPRATGGSNTDYNYGDCDASFTPWMSCAGKGLDLCGIDLTKTDLRNVDSTCLCSQATSLYNCYTSYCTTGTEYSAYYIGVSACAAGGFGSPPPAPTGAAATLLPNGGKPNAGSSVGGEIALWTMWVGLVVGTFGVMVL